MGKKIIWKIKELRKYKPKIDGSEIPPIYDLGKVNEVHREIDANIRPYWENLHPIVQDYLTAWSDSWTTLVHDIEDLESKIQQKEALNENLKSNFENKLDELNNTISSLKADAKSKTDEINQKEEFIKDLESESQLGISELREKLDKRLKEMAERQKKYEETQMQVGQAFQRKVLELDSELMSSREQLDERATKIKELNEELAALKKENSKLKFYESKAQDLEQKVNQITQILEIESEEEDDEDF